jgi:hypothetical protein
MFRLLLPAALCLCATLSIADTIILPKIGVAPQPAMPPFGNAPGTPENLQPHSGLCGR